MFRRFSVNFALFSIAFDALLVGLALRLAVLSRPLLNFLPWVKTIDEPVNVPVWLYLIFPLTWVMVLLVFAVYDGRRYTRLRQEAGAIFLGSLLAGVALAGILYLTVRDISRFLFLSFWFFGTFLLIFWRLAVRLALRTSVLPELSQRRVIILGAGQVGRKLAAEIHRQRELGLNLVGFLDDDPLKQAAPDVLGSLDQARAVLLEQKIDDAVIALPLSAHQRLNQIVAELHDLPVRVWVIPDYFSLTLHRASVDEFAGIPLLDLRAPALSEYQRMVKRAFDLTVCLLIAPLALPLIGLIALLVRLDSPGPVFYRARRVGENGRLFNMMKFRTMIVDADRLAVSLWPRDYHGNIMHKVRDDPRVTRVGRFLRRASLDELPQLWNVLIGEMSLVGPRPEMPELVERYEPWQRKRFAVPQGITGWWQINGRSDRPMHLNTQDDLYYVQHYSIWLDLYILARTVSAVIKARGAF